MSKPTSVRFTEQTSDYLRDIWASWPDPIRKRLSINHIVEMGIECLWKERMAATGRDIPETANDVI